MVGRVGLRAGRVRRRGGRGAGRRADGGGARCLQVAAGHQRVGRRGEGGHGERGGGGAGVQVRAVEQGAEGGGRQRRDAAERAGQERVVLRVGADAGSPSRRRSTVPSASAPMSISVPWTMLP